MISVQAEFRKGMGSKLVNCPFKAPDRRNRFMELHKFTLPSLTDILFTVANTDHEATLGK